METGNYKHLTFVNNTLPVDNQSITFNVPPNVSDFSINLGTRLPPHKYYYRYISDITYRVDTSGIYNITTTQTITLFGDDHPDGTTITIEPGFYDIDTLNSILSGSKKLIQPITLVGANAFKAIPQPSPGLELVRFFASPGVTSTELSAILNWPLKNGIINTINFKPDFPVDLTVGKDLMLVYLSFVRQSAENNQTDVVAIPISPGTGQLGFIVNGNFHSKTPVLESIDTISSATIRLRTFDNKPFLINTSVFINVKLLFSLKNKM